MDTSIFPRLRPCSVCGRELAEMKTARHLFKEPEYFVHCPYCCCETERYPSMEEAAAAWNQCGAGAE